jgi:2-polyprenyl-6-methoxyphenol hydroxylase-like FAD-dependent oxidoreductase
MAHTIVLGGGLCGLTAAMMLARDGHRVTVLERDPDPVPANPEEAWERWRRDGVTQFRQAHYLQPRGRQELDAELPDVRQALEDAGALGFNPLTAMPPSIADRAPRPGDERFVTWTGRRSTIEQVVGRAAENEPGVEIRRGVAVTALQTRRTDGRVHVTGVRTGDGERLAADLVLDAMGRASKLPKLLAAAGGDPVHEEAEDCGFLYYTRYFRGELPQIRGPLNCPVGSFSILTIPGDAGTWSITLYGSTRDPALKALRDPVRWTALVRACPRHAHWLDGEAITGVLPMGGVLNRQRSLNGNGAGPAIGVLSVGDAWACVNPSTGRGMSLGLAHAAVLRRVVREHGDRPVELVAAFAAATERELTPWYRATVASDNARLAEVEAIRTGESAPPPANPLAGGLAAAMGRDPDVFRAGLEIIACLALPREVFARPGLSQKVLENAADGPPPSNGPDRQQLLAILS